jgi:hypothetical protein
MTAALAVLATVAVALAALAAIQTVRLARMKGSMVQDAVERLGGGVEVNGVGLPPPGHAGWKALTGDNLILGLVQVHSMTIRFTHLATTGSP